MRRTAAQNVLDWVSSGRRKPLGRVGKTWLMERFEGRSRIFRLETAPASLELWDGDTAPERPLETLAWRSAGELLVFDGSQGHRRHRAAR